MGLLDAAADVIGDAPSHLEPLDGISNHRIRVLVGAVVGVPVGAITEPLEARSELIAGLGQPIGEDSQFAEHSVDVADVLPARYTWRRCSEGEVVEGSERFSRPLCRPGRGGHLTVDAACDGLTVPLRSPRKKPRPVLERSRSSR